MSVIYLAIFNDVVKSRGYKLEGCSSDVWRLADHRNRIPPRLFLDILDKTLCAIDQPGLGFQFGRELNLAAAGALGQLFMSAKTLGDAFQFFLEYYPLLSLSMKFETESENNSFSTEVSRLYRKSESDRVQFFVTETFFYCLLHSARWLSGEPLNFKRLQLCYARPPHGHMYEKYFGCPVEFSCSQMRLDVSREFLKAKILTANQPVLIFKEKQCKEKLHRLKKCFSISEQISTTLIQMQPVIPSQDAIAEQLNLSQSSLYRKLKEANTSYQKIVDGFRRDQALVYLKNTNLSICDIAANLGFSDSSNFRRAFKKWTGTTPTARRHC